MHQRISIFLIIKLFIMKTLLKLTLIITVLFTLTTGCNKYEEGPKFSLLTKKARISGEWKIQNVTVNGTDVTSTVNTFLGANYVLDIEKDGGYKESGLFPDTGKWKFGEDKDDVYLTSDVAGSKEEAFRILRLKNKELWLRSTATNGDQTIIKYEPAN